MNGSHQHGTNCLARLWRCWCPTECWRGLTKANSTENRKAKNITERHPMRTCKIVLLHCNMSESESCGRRICCLDVRCAVMLALTYPYMKPSPFSCSTHAPARSSDWS